MFILSAFLLSRCLNIYTLFHRTPNLVANATSFLVRSSLIHNTSLIFWQPQSHEWRDLRRISVFIPIRVHEGTRGVWSYVWMNVSPFRKYLSFQSNLHDARILFEYILLLSTYVCSTAFATLVSKFLVDVEESTQIYISHYHILCSLLKIGTSLANERFLVQSGIAMILFFPSERLLQVIRNGCIDLQLTLLDANSKHFSGYHRRLWQEV